jgi:type IV pilus assembly protein PilA
MGGNKMKMNKKGFTLIELLIVVAIIAILAAIAIPQFSQYRIRAYNASGMTDLRNVRVSEEALFSDWRRYGASENAALAAVTGAAANPGALAIGPTGPANPTILGTVEASVLTPRGLEIAVGAGNRLIASDDVAWASFVIQSKNDAGDTLYACDSDSTANYRAQNPTYIGVQLQASADRIVTVVAGGVEVALGAAPWSSM